MTETDGSGVTTSYRACLDGGFQRQVNDDCTCTLNCASGKNCQCGGGSTDACGALGFSTTAAPGADDCFCYDPPAPDVRTVPSAAEGGVMGQLADLAVTAGFDWVLYEDSDTVQVSVIPDACESDVDVIFLLDGSASVVDEDWEKSIDFVLDVLEYFELNTTVASSSRVGLATYSHTVETAYDLNTYNSKEVGLLLLPRLACSSLNSHHPNHDFRSPAKKKPP